MRIKVCMSADEEITLPIAYNHIIQKSIYNILDNEYASKLHDSGYRYKNKIFKLFNFSKLIVQNKTINNGKITIHKGKVELIICSIDESFIFKIISALIKHKCLKFKEGVLEIDEIYSKKQLNRERAVVLTISPVVVVKPTIESRTEFYNPRDKEFLISIKNNIIAKYNSFYNEEYKGILNISILDENNIRKKIDKYKKWIYEGYLGGFIIEGDTEIVELAYSCGLGSKNSQGFGCIETFKDLNGIKNYSRMV
ncbi:MAG: CRISPR-associated endoribonuclease Cas6 [Clostridium botulinum]|nr:CRISPR-associated endoribonuclease Cas6 [Clostridium botulinum]